MVNSDLFNKLVGVVMMMFCSNGSTVSALVVGDDDSVTSGSMQLL